MLKLYMAHWHVAPQVLSALRPLMLVVAATQPVNAVTFVLDGVLYGAGGFRWGLQGSAAQQDGSQAACNSAARIG